MDDLPKTRETLSHSDDYLGYYLSKQINYDDSLFVVLYNQAIEENHTFEPSLHAFIFGLSESRDIKKKVLCDVLLRHAKTKEDSVFVRQTMLPPFQHSSEYGYRVEFRQRVLLVKEHLSIR